MKWLLLVLIVTLSGCKAQLAEKPINDTYSELREKMVSEQLVGRGVIDEKVLDVMKKIPRHEFVPRNIKEHAYEDRPLPIGYGQTISQPYIVALMTQELELGKNDKVLEVGTGSGYQAAVLSGLVRETYSIEIIKELANIANETLKRLDYEVEVKNADGYFGWEEKAPFDAIMVTAAADHIPPPLLEQLKDNGKLIIPLGSTLQFQTLTLVKKVNNSLETRFITGVRFVPMTGTIQKKS